MGLMSKAKRFDRGAYGAIVIMMLIAVGASFAKPQAATGPKDGPEIGKNAPEFSLVDLEGDTHKLSDYKGKIVVLEWFNPTSTYVVDQYTNRTLKTFGNKMHRKSNVVYLAINSTASGKPGSAKDENVDAQKRFGMKFPILLDGDGKVAGAYKARFTPQMYVIDEKGVLQYMGAIDNAPLGKVNATYPPGKDGKAGVVVNYVEQAIDEIEADESVTTPTTKPYGSRIAR